MLHEADRKAGERLRELALEFSSTILANPSTFSEVARWLLTLPRCRHTKSNANPATGEIVDEDDEDDYARLCGPICRKLEDGWTCALYPFPPGSDRFIDFGIEDAKRIAVLAALTFDKDFDGADIGIGWNWEKPRNSSEQFEGRQWAWSLHTSSPGSAATLLRFVDEASRVLRIKLPLALRRTSPQGGAPAVLELDRRIELELNAREQLIEGRSSGAPKRQDLTMDLPERLPLSPQAQAMYRILCALPQSEGRRAKRLAQEMRHEFPGIDEDRIRRLAQELKPYGVKNNNGYYVPLSQRPKGERT